MFSRILAGSSKGIVSLSTTIVSDVTDIGQRSKGMVGLVEGEVTEDTSLVGLWLTISLK